MVRHLMKAGHELRVFTRTRQRADDLVAEGAAWCAGPAEAASGAEVVAVMVGYPRDVEDVVLGPQGVLAAAPGGACLIDFTTSSPALARRIAEAAAERGVASLDAPVSGGDVGARNATLSIMVGGDRAAFERVQPVLHLLGKTVVYQGEAGMGQHTKMVNQILIATNMIGVCEGLLYARKAGLDPETVLQSVSGGAAASWSLTNLLPRILKDDLEPGFFVEHFVKDMEIALAECERMHIRLPGLELARELYGRLVDMDLGRKGTQALVRALESMPG
jgi:3-hydroxyisobutyrate dehydrogenase